MKKLVMYSI